MTQSSLTAMIQRAVVSYKFQNSSFKFYIGVTDHVVHIRHLCQQMVVHSNNDAMLCKAFSASLYHKALQWFKRLPSDSVASINSMSGQFLRNHSNCIHKRRRIDNLFEISEGYYKSNKDYADRFEAIQVRVENPGRHLALMEFTKVLLADPTIIDNHTYDGLVLNNFKMYQNAEVLIFNHLKFENIKRARNINLEESMRYKKKKLSQPQ